MYIKRIIIEGFKGYRRRTAPDDFDSRLNVVVGLNGSGKTNLFTALEFIFGRNYIKLSDQEKRHLLHDGSGPHIRECYIEVVLDNTDLKFPINAAEVIIRRTITSSSDRYTLNRKSINTSEIVTLLEASGFYSSYFIIKQGTINAIATSSESRLLFLIYEVAGVVSFEEKIKKLRGRIEEVKDIQTNIIKWRDLLKNDLGSLRKEAAEYKIYKDKEESRKTLEYLIHKAQLEEQKNKLFTLEENIKRKCEDQIKMNTELSDLTCSIYDKTKEIDIEEQKLILLKEKHDFLLNEIDHSTKDLAKIHCDLEDLQEKKQYYGRKKLAISMELEDLEQKEVNERKKLENINPIYESLKKQEEDLNQELLVKCENRKNLYKISGMDRCGPAGFHWRKEELQSLNAHIQDKVRYITNLRLDIEKDEHKLKEIRSKLDNILKYKEQEESIVFTNNKCMHDISEKKQELLFQRQEIWEKENSLKQDYLVLRENFEKYNRMLSFKVGFSTIRGCESVQEIVRNNSVEDGYYGLLIDSFECEKSLNTVIEAIAGKKLFYHIVDSDVVATTILNVINENNMPGEVNFLPINRLQRLNLLFPEDDDAVPLITKLRFDSAYRNVIEFIFGRYLVCRDMDCAIRLSKSFRFNCITLQGDLISNNGTLCGGYYEKRNLLVDVHKVRMELLIDLTQCENELAKTGDDLKTIISEISQVENEIEKLETKKFRSEDRRNRILADAELLRKEFETVEKSREYKNDQLLKSELELKLLHTTKNDLIIEPEDDHDLQQLNTEIKEIETKRKQIFQERFSVEIKKNEIDNLLTNNLWRRKEELNSLLGDISSKEKELQLTDKREYYSSLQNKLKNLKHKASDIIKNIQDQTTLCVKRKSVLENLKISKKNLEDNIFEHKVTLEKKKEGKNLLLDSVRNLEIKVADIKCIPSQSLQNHYNHYNLNALYNELETVNKDIDKYCAINMKAIFFLQQVSDKMEIFEKRIELVIDECRTIEEILQEKEETCQKIVKDTFEKLSHSFSNMFERLVPSGKAKLIIIRRDNSSCESMDGDSTLDDFRGVAIRASFNIAADKTLLLLNHFSGGQKTLISLALILAIQKCDPSPFYIFDEFEQHLDEKTKRRAAEVISKFSSKAQYIISTFHKELLQYSNKIFKVTIQDNASSISTISKNDAMQFVKNISEGDVSSKTF